MALMESSCGKVNCSFPVLIVFWFQQQNRLHSVQTTCVELNLVMHVIPGVTSIVTRSWSSMVFRGRDVLNAVVEEHASSAKVSQEHARNQTESTAARMVRAIELSLLDLDK